MRYNAICRFLLIVFTVGVTIFSIVSSLLRPQILVIQSYSSDTYRTAQFNLGLESVLARHSEILIDNYYMDSQLLLNNAALARTTKQTLKFLAHAHPSLVILMGDNAINAAASVLAQFPNQPFLFSNASIKAAEYDLKKVTNARGIVERIPMSFMVGVLSAIVHQDYQDIRIISDQTPLALTLNDELKNADWSPFKIKEVTACKTFAEWQAAFNAANQTHSLIIIPRYRGLLDAQGKIVPSQLITQWTVDHSSNPLVAGSADFVQEGGPLAIDVSNYEEGKTVAEMAVALLNSKTPLHQLQTTTTKNYLLLIRKSSYDKLYKQYPLPPLLKALASNVDNYYE